LETSFQKQNKIFKRKYRLSLMVFACTKLNRI
jgi:hypothetical protein